MPVSMNFGAPLGDISSGPKFAMLWENPDPTSSFSAQTVSGNFSGYEYYIVEIAMTASGTHAMCFCKKGEFSLSSCGQSSYWYSRKITLTNTDATFTTGYRNGTAGAGYAIPVSIVGVKL